MPLLNVVSFDVPFPPNYGGVIDVFYKLRWLKECGVDVILHCFYSGRKAHAELESMCAEVHYYKRKTGIRSNLSLDPYNVVSRRAPGLINSLLSNDAPILFEVLHTCELMKDPKLKDRMKIYRHSNIEHIYYRELAKSEKQLTKKLYLLIESIKLRRFERVLKHADTIMAVSMTDAKYFQKRFPAADTHYVPSFHPYAEANVRDGLGQYVLFHGNLSVSENYESAMWLIDQVFSQLLFRVVIAGLDPPDFLRRKAAKYPHIEIVANPSGEKMDELIAGAQVHCLHTHQGTGLKLKLLHVLFRGRYIVANPEMVEGTGIGASATLRIAGTANEYVSDINQLFSIPFEQAHIQQRVELLKQFDNLANAKKIVEIIYSQLPLEVAQPV